MKNVSQTRKSELALHYFQKETFPMSPLTVHSWVPISVSACNLLPNAISGFVTEETPGSHRYVNQKKEDFRDHMKGSLGDVHKHFEKP